MTARLISNKVLQERYLELLKRGYTPSQIVSWLGWKERRSNGAQDSLRLEKRLGLLACYNGKNRMYKKQTTITESKALEIASALALDPVDIGL